MPIPDIEPDIIADIDDSQGIGGDVDIYQSRRESLIRERFEESGFYIRAPSAKLSSVSSRCTRTHTEGTDKPAGEPLLLEEVSELGLLQGGCQKDKPAFETIFVPPRSRYSEDESTRTSIDQSRQTSISEQDSNLRDSIGSTPTDFSITLWDSTLRRPRYTSSPSNNEIVKITKVTGYFESSLLHRLKQV